VGGVAKAVIATYTEQEAAKINPVTVQGLKECIQALRSAAGGKFDHNFIECMACKAGCISGPGVLVNSNTAGRAVDTFSKEVVNNK
jgi:iron only hydrogenase large subunit-like protein